MNGKKKYLVIALLLLLGFGAISFAGGDEEELEPVGGNSSKVEDKKDETEKFEDVVTNDEEDEDEDTTTATTTQNASNSNTVNNEELTEEPEVEVDLSQLVTNTETMIYDAASKENIEEAKEYFDNNEIKELVDSLENGEQKNNLQKRVEELEKVFEDTTSPVISGIEPNAVTKENVSIKITDDLEFKTTVTLNDQEVEFKDLFDQEGVYTITVIDKAQNKTELTFTIDKTAPKLNEISSGNHYTDITIDVVDKSDVTIEVQKDHKDTTEVENGASLTEEGTYKITLTDEAGNKSIIWTAIDNTKPTISGVTNNSYVNKCDKIYVEDRYLTEVKINDEVFTRDDFTHNIYSEDFKFNKRVCNEGTYTITATDKIGNVYTETFTIDKTNPTLNYSTLRLNGNVYNETVDGTIYYYVKNGDVIEYAMAFNEKLKNAPKVTIGGKEVVMTLNPQETYRDEKRIYLYEGKVTFTEEDNIENGLLDIVVSEVIDLAGNETTDENILNPVTTTNHRALMYDSVSPKVNYIAVLSKKDKYNEAIKGDTIRFLIQFNEEINLSSKTFKLKIDGKEVSFMRSQGTGYEYIAEYKIPENTTLETGNLKFEIYGYKDKAGNTGETLTKATHSKYNNVFFDGIAPTIKIKGNQGLNKNEHRIVEGSRVYLSYVLATVTDNIDETTQIEPVSIKRYYPAETGKASHIYELEGEGDYRYFDTSNPGERYELTYEYTDSYGNKTTRTMLMPIDAYRNPEADENGVINITKNINNGYIPFYNVTNNDKEITINGNNHTVTQTINEDAFYWNAKGNVSMLGNVFSSTNGSKITVNDLTFKGTTGTITLGHYTDTKSDKYNTELNNVNMIGLNVVSYSSGIAPAVVAYGKSTLNNVNLYGTKLSELDTNPAWPVWDLALVNYTTTNINNSKVGSIYTWAKTSITISNSEVDTIYSQSRKTSDMTTGGLTVENNSKVNKIVVANKNAIINIKSGSVVDTIDFNGLDKTNMTIIIEDGATVNNQIN